MHSTASGVAWRGLVVRRYRVGRRILLPVSSGCVWVCARLCRAVGYFWWSSLHFISYHLALSFQPSLGRVDYATCSTLTVDEHVPAVLAPAAQPVCAVHSRSQHVAWSVELDVPTSQVEVAQAWLSMPGVVLYS